MAVLVRDSSAAITSKYLTMNEAMATRTVGTRSRCSPRRMSGTSVVAASNTEAPAPRVALANTFQAPMRPSTESESGPQDTRGPAPTKGRRKAKRTNGKIDGQPGEKKAGRDLGHVEQGHQDQGVSAEGPDHLGRGRHHR